MVTCLRTRQHTQVNLCKYLAAPRRHNEQQLFPKRSYTWPTFPESPYPGAILLVDEYTHMVQTARAPLYLKG